MQKSGSSKIFAWTAANPSSSSSSPRARLFWCSSDKTPKLPHSSYLPIHSTLETRSASSSSSISSRMITPMIRPATVCSSPWFISIPSASLDSCRFCIASEANCPAVNMTVRGSTVSVTRKCITSSSSSPSPPLMLCMARALRASTMALMAVGWMDGRTPLSSRNGSPIFFFLDSSALLLPLLSLAAEMRSVISMSLLSRCLSS
mmetsp:Transcript_23494/g.51430  ORF Transcript_23494/g.51430 Transcript_23494/m.51430 type:complete len:204 (-) Transcript_23494:547-1158(-)